MPTASTRTTRERRPLSSRTAISEAIQPPIEEPMTTTSRRPSSVSFLRNAAA
jgi:hypothetical protein